MNPGYGMVVVTSYCRATVTSFVVACPCLACPYSFQLQLRLYGDLRRFPAPCRRHCPVAAHYRLLSLASIRIRRGLKCKGFVANPVESAVGASSSGGGGGGGGSGDDASKGGLVTCVWAGKSDPRPLFVVGPADTLISSPLSVHQLSALAEAAAMADGGAAAATTVTRPGSAATAATATAAATASSGDSSDSGGSGHGCAVFGLKYTVRVAGRAYPASSSVLCGKCSTRVCGVSSVVVVPHGASNEVRFPSVDCVVDAASPSSLPAGMSGSPCSCTCMFVEPDAWAVSSGAPFPEALLSAVSGCVSLVAITSRRRGNT